MIDENISISFDFINSRIFDIDSGNCISTIDFPSPPNSIEISRDGRASLLITHGKKVEIYDGNTYVFDRFISATIHLLDLYRLSKLQSFEMPCEMNTASFHPTAREFVCGGLDFRIYKYNVETGVELGQFNRSVHFSRSIFFLFIIIIRIIQRSFWSNTFDVLFTRWRSLCIGQWRWNITFMAKYRWKYLWSLGNGQCLSSVLKEDHALFFVPHSHFFFFDCLFFDLCYRVFACTRALSQLKRKENSQKKPLTTINNKNISKLLSQEKIQSFPS